MPLADDLAGLLSGQHYDPHRLLGWHGDCLRVMDWSADQVSVELSDGSSFDLVPRAPGLFELDHPPTAPDAQTGRVEYLVVAKGLAGWQRVNHDPYSFWPTVGELDLHLIGEGRHRRLFDVLGARPITHQGVEGTAFAVWAPSARSVRVVGDFNHWDGRVHPMRVLGSSGVWEIFLPGVGPGERYKYEILGADGSLRLKADPLAREAERPPSTASVVPRVSQHRWSDQSWMRARATTNWVERPVSIYEVHIGSWRVVPEEGGRPLTYREAAELLPGYLTSMGFTHVEFMPLAEHPFGGSWGYQVTGYFAPTSRFGSPDDLRALVDALHRSGIGVIMDWVPAHFPKDDWALARFDGTALYEHADPRQGEHPDWGTLIFNYGRNEVRNFLIANALYWLEEFHIDGLRVDAVASMLYLDYSREDWIPNQYGGRENLEAVSFIRELNEIVYAEQPGIMMIAEESTAWPGVSRPTFLGGLGFGFKWNMGWMHDTLEYMHRDPVHRKYHQGMLTFGLVYAYSENFILPLSHDEVVHGKRSLAAKMPGDAWQQLANLRSLFAWMWAHPGKKLIFMGGELGQWSEWRHDSSLEWHLLDFGQHAGIQRLVRDLNRIYHTHPSLYLGDQVPESFGWIDFSDSDSNVLSFLRRDPSGLAQPIVCVANLSPVVRSRYRVGLPAPGEWVELLNSDLEIYGGSNVSNTGPVVAEPVPWHQQGQSAELVLPPLAVTWLTPR
jgi:1,4-alpha-glucan branching enzyme